LPALRTFHQPGARPVVGRVEAQTFPEVVHRLLAPALFEQRPALVRVGKGVVRIARQCAFDGYARFGFATEFHQGHGAEVVAGVVLRIELQSHLRSIQSRLPLAAVEFDSGQHAVVISIGWLKANGLLNHAHGLGLAIAGGEHPGQCVVREGEIGRVSNGFAGRLFGIVEPLLLQQADGEKRVAESIVGILH
jgi:hypothetical protein